MTIRMLKKQIIRNDGIKDSVEIIDGYIPDNEVEKYFMTCDIVVFPYESETQRGIVQIAYRFDKPFIDRESCCEIKRVARN